MNGVPEARAPFAAIAGRGRSCSSSSSEGSRNVIATVDPGASAASRRSVAALASRVRYMLTPVEATTAGAAGEDPASASSSHQDAPAPGGAPPRGRGGEEPAPGQQPPPGRARLEVDRDQVQPGRDAVADLGQP